MGKATPSKKIKRAVKTPEQKAYDLARKIGMPEEQIAAGVTLHDVVEGAQTIGRTVRILYPFIVDRWLASGGPGFDDPERAAIEHCRGLWIEAGDCGRLVARLDGVGGGGGGRERDRMAQMDAIIELRGYQRRLPRHVWDVFENVVRHNLPAGRAGSDLASNNAQQQAAAKACVGFAASMIAQWRGFREESLAS